jgi:hypothetical protein
MLILGLLVTGTATTVVLADDIPEVFDYAFDAVDPIKIYAGPVIFRHAGHVTDHGLDCNACHHTLDPGDTEIDGHCSDCHTEPGFIRGKEAQKMDRDRLIEHYLNALHMQCIGCHKEKKIEDRKRKIPVGCTQCHDRRAL